MVNVKSLYRWKGQMFPRPLRCGVPFSLSVYFVLFSRTFFFFLLLSLNDLLTIRIFSPQP